MNYKIILMKRPMVEVLASQHKMRQRLGTGSSTASDETLGELFSRQLSQTEHWLQNQRNMVVLVVRYQDAVLKPEVTAITVARFIGIPLDTLYRNIAP